MAGRPDPVGGVTTVYGPFTPAGEKPPCGTLESCTVDPAAGKGPRVTVTTRFSTPLAITPEFVGVTVAEAMASGGVSVGTTNVN